MVGKTNELSMSQPISMHVDDALVLEASMIDESMTLKSILKYGIAMAVGKMNECSVSQ